MNGNIRIGSGNGYHREAFGYPDGCKDCVCNDLDNPKIIHRKDCDTDDSPYTPDCECEYCECDCHLDPDDFMFDDSDNVNQAFYDEDY